ncbi:MAG: hypothetical protein J5I93_09515 [Pirellulaceae bacterium]|nr:hypothetical protein [Pirellulaceae bacterium]
MIDRFEIIDHNSSRPKAEHILFCDGTGGRSFRVETDLELSHWRPNRTPVEYRAGTSTEICFRFLDHPRPGSWTAAVNNHVDVDGILSVYVLVHSEHALAHRKSIIEAAEMGDFWGWGEPPAQRVFQGVTHLMQRGGDPQAVYAEAFRRIPGLIDGSDSNVAQMEHSLAALREGVELVQQGRIVRREIDARLTQYVIPLPVAGDDDARASYVPEFNEAISPKALLWPQVRACWDAERVCLVSVERTTGWFHDLWFPGYLWADTEDKWLVPGVTYHDGMSRYEIQNDPLIAAFVQLQQMESAPGRWALGGTSLPFSDELQERFPLVGRFLDEEGQVNASGLSPDQVAKTLEGVFV